MKPSIILLVLIATFGFYSFFTSKDELDLVKLSPYIAGGVLGWGIAHYYSHKKKNNKNESDS